jgi:hypothetical protein
MAEEEEEVEEGEEKPAEAGASPPPSEIHVNLTENAKFVASKLDDLFATVAKIQVNSLPTPTTVGIEFHACSGSHLIEPS